MPQAPGPEQDTLARNPLPATQEWPPAGAMSRSWVMRFRPQAAAALRVVCFHHAGGGASSYRPWAGALPAWLELCAIQLPGREGRFREKPYRHLEDLVAVLAEVIEPLLDRPFAFFGHSLGAILAFEVARALQRRGSRSPVHLFVSGRRAPSRPDPDPAMSHLPERAFVSEMRRRWDGIPAAVLSEPELLQLLLPTLRADIALVENYVYVPGSPLECPISCFGGTEDPSLRETDLEPWRLQTRDAFSQRMFPGGHFFIQNSRDQVLAAVKQDLHPVMSRIGPARLRG
jgi:medium-chain acyl-[acyl-carrier-protein] hydrolase